MAVYTSISESIRNATEETDTTNMLDTTAIVGPLAPAFSAALNEVFSKMPSTVDGSTATDLVTESQQISAVQARKLVDSIPREFGKSAPVGGLNTTIYAVRRGGITPNDVTNIGDRLCNIARSPYYNADANRAPMVVVLDVNTSGEVTRYTNEVNEGLALAVESMCAAFNIPVVGSLPAALKAMRRK